MTISESLNIERRYTCCAILNFEPVAPPATGGSAHLAYLVHKSGRKTPIIIICANNNFQLSGDGVELVVFKCLPHTNVQKGYYGLFVVPPLPP